MWFWWKPLKLISWNDAYMQHIRSTCDVITCNYSHLTHVVTCLATMSSLMRTKSTRWSAAMPNALWMLCKSAATSGRVEDSIQRGLQKRTDTTRSHDQPTAAPDVCHTWAVLMPFRTVCVESLKFPILNLLYIPTEDLEHLASMVVRIQHLRFCCLCQNSDDVCQRKKNIKDRFD